ncbi:tRNA synthetases class I, catalytic domain-containing protein [Phlyctochytrium arcticum]|nr:tRNA synthetases class I, catalytic domain-containing protein [Phlyctochytrium arcticum]
MAKVSAQDQGSFDVGLKDVEHGKVVTRFPPEPSGYLHIGHAKAALLNDYFARRYDGKLIIRFDDTNPTKEKSEFEEAIKEDLRLIGVIGDVITYTSDSFDAIYNYALEMIKSGKAYVDNTDVETMRAERMVGTESKCRNTTVEENLRLFEEMKQGTEHGLTCCLRAKIDMKAKNKTLCDPVLYRCNLTPHHRTGTKWKIYPTYDFACPIVDSLEGVTHALRTNEYRDRNAQYEWILNALNLRHVHIWDYGKINFVYTLLSKRKLTWFVNEGLVTGWDDPRFPTVRGIRRRGMTIEALRTYILMQGASQKTLELEWDKIWTVNKRVIDPISPRHTALDKEKLTPVNVVGEEVKLVTKEMPKHKKNPELGNKLTSFSGELYIAFEDAKGLELGEEVTFMDWGNVVVKNIEWAEDKASIKQIEITLNLDGDFKKTKKKLTWLSRAASPSLETKPVDLVLHDYDYLITKKKMEDEDEIKDFVTPVTEFKTEAIGDANLRKLKKGDFLQLERKGYYICDKEWNEAKPEEPIHLIYIPDGKTASLISKADQAAPEAAAKGAKGRDGRESKKQAKKKEAAEKKSAMYDVKSTYNDMLPVDVDASSKMYKVESVYGVEDAEVKKDKKKKEDKAAPTANQAETTPEPAKKSEKKPKAAKEAPVADTASLISKLDICVGRILDVKRHPDADTLYVEQIDVGEDAPREVVSGLVKYMTEDEMRGKNVLILKNLKPVSMRGVKSFAMVLCASDEAHGKVEFLVPPEGSQPGDKVFFEGHEGEPEAILNPKKKVFETVQPGFTSGEDLVATWNGIPFRTKKGVVKAASIVNACIR